MKTTTSLLLTGTLYLALAASTPVHVAGDGAAAEELMEAKK